jgi:MoaA/NifB/PqqE/SkfB family radical SAM enzyme
MIEKLREFLQSFFVSIQPASYYFRAPFEAPTPYLVYALEVDNALDDSGKLKVVSLYVDVFGENDIELDRILDVLDEKAAELDEIRGCLGVTGFRRYPRLDVEESYPLYHKQTSYNLHVYY